MSVRWLPALIVTAAVLFSGCKSEEQCWVDRTAEISFCNDKFFECWSEATDRYESTACYNETYDTCMGEVELDLWECTGSGDCAGIASACIDECGTSEDASIELCTAAVEDCWGDDSCFGDRFACDLACSPWDDACLDNCKVDMFVCSGGESCEEKELDSGATGWECTGEDAWYDWVCEETCEAFGNFCAAQAECGAEIQVGDNCPPDELLDLAVREDFDKYIQAMGQCEEDRRICSMCCYDVDYHPDISCSDIDWDAMAQDFPI